MNGIGLSLKETREESGVSIHEASEDLGIKEVVLENIEDGNIGSFKDIFELKTNILDYAKYLGLDLKEVEEKFDTYIFEYTSKIPVKEIEKQVLEQKVKENKEDKIVSPYTASKTNKKSRRMFIIIYAIIFVLLAFIIGFSIRQLTFNNHETNEIAYGK